MRGARPSRAFVATSATAAVAFAGVACAGSHAASTSTSFVARATGDRANPSGALALVQVEHLEDGALRPFAAARRAWVRVLSRKETTDGRGLFVQTGDSGFLSIRPLPSLGALDREPPLVRAALAAVDPKDELAYHQASDALLAPPHRSEIWRFDPDLSYGTTDPLLALSTAAWGKMTVEELDPTPGGDLYSSAWKEVREALVTQSYPLVRVTYWSVYGSGHLVSFWLAKTQAEFLSTPPVLAAVRAALGAEQADAIFGRMRKAVLASDSVDVIPRLDLSSRTL